MSNSARNGRRLRCAAITTAIAAIAAAGMAGSADAASAATPIAHKTEVTMRVVGFDSAVARAHGYEIRTTADGKQYSVRAGEGVDAEPAGEVSGDCGRSWVYETAIGSHSVGLETGFQVNGAVLDFEWIVYLDDPGGETHLNYPSGSGNGYWDDVRTISGLTPGSASAVVRGGGSNFAVLTNGSVCYSPGVSASTVIY